MFRYLNTAWFASPPFELKTHGHIKPFFLQRSSNCVKFESKFKKACRSPRKRFRNQVLSEVAAISTWPLQQQVQRRPRVLRVLRQSVGVPHWPRRRASEVLWPRSNRYSATTTACPSARSARASGWGRPARPGAGWLSVTGLRESCCSLVARGQTFRTYSRKISILKLARKKWLERVKAFFFIFKSFIMVFLTRTLGTRNKESTTIVWRPFSSEN